MKKPCGCVYKDGIPVLLCDAHEAEAEDEAQAESAAEYLMECCCPDCGLHEDDCECPDGPGGSA